MDANHQADVLAFLLGRSVRVNWTNEQRQYYRRTYTVDKNGVLRDIRTNLPVAVSDELTKMIEKAHLSPKNEHRSREETVAAMRETHHVPDIEQQVRRYMEKCSYCTLQEEKKAVALELEKRTGLLVKREKYIAQLQNNEANDSKKTSTTDSDANDREIDKGKVGKGIRSSLIRSQSEKPTEANRKKVRFEHQDELLHQSLELDRPPKGKSVVDVVREGTLSRTTKSTLSDMNDTTLRRSRLALERQSKIEAKTDSVDENSENGHKQAGNDQRETARLQAIIDRMTDAAKQKDKIISEYHMKLCDANMRLFSAEKKLQDEKERHLTSVQRLNAELERERAATLKAKQTNESLRTAYDRDKDRLEKAQQDLNSQSERMRKMIKAHS